MAFKLFSLDIYFFETEFPFAFISMHKVILSQINIKGNYTSAKILVFPLNSVLLDEDTNFFTSLKIKNKISKPAPSPRLFIKSGHSS